MPLCNNFVNTFGVSAIKDFNPSHAAIKVSINATAAEFICKKHFSHTCAGKKNYKK